MFKGPWKRVPNWTSHNQFGIKIEQKKLARQCNLSGAPAMTSLFLKSDAIVTSIKRISEHPPYQNFFDELDKCLSSFYPEDDHFLALGGQAIILFLRKLAKKHRSSITDVQFNAMPHFFCKHVRKVKTVLCFFSSLLHEGSKKTICFSISLCPSCLVES